MVINAEAAGTGGDLPEEIGEALGEVRALVADAGEFPSAGFAMGGAGIVADRFLVHVELLEREDGKAINDHSGCLGIARDTGFHGPQFVDEHLVHFLDEVVALLVEAVNGALGPVDAFGAEVVAAGDVFLVPKLEIPEVVFLHKEGESLARGGGLLAVPKGGEGRLRGGDFVRVEVHGEHRRAFTVAGGRDGSKPASMPEPGAVAPLESLLVVKPSSLGDIVHGLQVMQTVARIMPDCRITWVARDRFAPLVEAAPFVHETIHYRRKEGWRGLKEVMGVLRGRRFDAVWDMQGLLRSGLMTAAARAQVKTGRRDCRECAGIFYNQRVDLPEGPGPHHAIPILQGFATSIGLDGEITFPLELRPGPDFPWEGFFRHDGPCLVIFTDSRGVEKEWRGFDELTRLIWEKIPNSRVAWCAGKAGKPAVAAPDGRFLNLTGCPLDEMIALVRQPSVFIGNDSGPMHLSAAVGNRVLAIFGPTSPERFGPWPVGSPRTEAVVAPGGVLADLSAEAVMSSLRGLLDWS